MAFYQNVIDQEFRGNWVLGDRTYALDFNCPPNVNRSDYQLAWNAEPYDLSVNNTLTLNYAWDVNFKNYSSLAVNVAGASPAATLASEVAAALNANSIFAEMWVANVIPMPAPHALQSYNPPPYSVIITKKSGRIKQNIRLWISNGGACQVLGFNAKAPIAQLPNYMDRHTIANRFAFTDSQACLIRLSHNITAISVANPTQITTADPHGLTTGQTVDIFGSNSTPTVNGTRVATVIDANNFTVPVNVTVAGTEGYELSDIEYNLVVAAGFTPANMLADWQLLGGRGSGLFEFTKSTLDGSGRVVTSIIYGTGAQVGDFAKKIQYTYSGASTNPTAIMETPYVLTAADLLTPP